MPKKRARAYWKGFLRLSLVSIGVEIYNAVESASEISFRQIHKPSGRRVQYEKTVPGVGKIDNADIVKGYEVDTDTYVTLEPEEIDALKLESKKTIDLVQFVDTKEIDYRYFERPYFVAPADELAGEGYVVIRDALRKTGKVGLAQVTIGGTRMAGRHRAAGRRPGDGDAALRRRAARSGGLLRRGADHQAGQGNGRSRRAADRQEIRAPSSPSSTRTTIRCALKELVQDKLKGHKIIAHEEASARRGTNVVDLMEALKRSIGQGGDKSPPAKGAAKSKASRSKKSA